MFKSIQDFGVRRLVGALFRFAEPFQPCASVATRPKRRQAAALQKLARKINNLFRLISLPDLAFLHDERRIRLIRVDSRSRRTDKLTDSKADSANHGGNTLDSLRTPGDSYA